MAAMASRPPKGGIPQSVNLVTGNLHSLFIPCSDSLQERSFCRQATPQVGIYRLGVATKGAEALLGMRSKPAKGGPSRRPPQRSRHHVLHRVVNRHARSDRTARRINIELDIAHHLVQRLPLISDFPMRLPRSFALRFRKGQGGRQIASRLFEFRSETLLVTDPFNSVPIVCRRFYISRLGILSLHDDSKDMLVFRQMVGDRFRFRQNSSCSLSMSVGVIIASVFRA
jgi:hypothetical protein